MGNEPDMHENWLIRSLGAAGSLWLATGIALAQPAPVPAPVPAGQAVAPGAGSKAPGNGFPAAVTDRLELPNGFSTVLQLEGHEGVAAVSQNGRYVMRGVVFDMWEDKTLESVAAMRESLSTISLSRFGLKEEDVRPFHYGTGPQEVVVFVDPYCPFCHQLFAEMKSNPAYAEQFTWTIYTVSYLGDNSTRAVTALSCAEDQEASLRALMDHDVVYYQRAFDARGDSCDPQPILQRMILAQMVGAAGTPYLIGPRGGVSNGMPPSLAGFLQNN